MDLETPLSPMEGGQGDTAESGNLARSGGRQARPARGLTGRLVGGGSETTGSPRPPGDLQGDREAFPRFSRFLSDPVSQRVALSRPWP